jgi:hypothetical protein
MGMKHEKTQKQDTYATHSQQGTYDPEPSPVFFFATFSISADFAMTVSFGNGFQKSFITPKDRVVMYSNWLGFSAMLG